MEKKLYRNGQEKKIAGVCSGLADYFEVDVTIVRVAFILSVFAGFCGIPAYILFWIVMPVKSRGYQPGYQGGSRTHYSPQS
ncbi:MAG: PspC domain-containing protein [Daejeonella sp.]